MAIWQYGSLIWRVSQSGNSQIKIRSGTMQSPTFYCLRREFAALREKENSRSSAKRREKLAYRRSWQKRVLLHGQETAAHTYIYRYSYRWVGLCSS